ncbi:DEAD/DEAH box helicase [Alicyclobacillus sp. ALC3]|uniref:DEAD/DEAH box helicase n=1 Tax=Alicyclobacillus sp. ALC3 TaxID=2796143 RepID=UPI002378EAC5|nr:DEAD/DEAH box helicase [Alicyclobacillus sp. ALC3]WDL99717.1 hypothetical protein JC200_24100 [Alicyclobacillus sp. ALC3]
MKIIAYSDQKNYLEAAVHMTVTRPGEKGDNLIAAGIVDLDSTTRAIVAHAIKGDRLRIKENRRTFNANDLFTDKYAYRFVTRPIGKLTHAVLIHKSALDEQLEPGVPRVLLVPAGGDVADLFLHRFANDFNLPYVPEWKDDIWQTCKERDFVQNLTVWTDEGVAEWKDLQAFELAPELTEDEAKDVLGQLLGAGVIQLPEGLTDAPALPEALQPDESGEYQVIDYLQTYAPHLATTIEEMAAPAHDLDRPIDAPIAQMGRVPFPAQAHTVQAILNGYENSKGVITTADMGTGKTITAIATANALSARATMHAKRGFACMVLAPGITLPKWQNTEIGLTLPNARVTTIRNWKDLVRYRDKRVRGGNKEEIEFLLLSRDTAKLGMPKAPALIHKDRMAFADRANLEPAKKPILTTDPSGMKVVPGEADRANGVYVIHDAWVCPECHGIQQTTDKTAIKEAKKLDSGIEQLLELKLGFNDLAAGIGEHQALSFGGVRRLKKQYLFHKSITEYHCSECGANLMRDLVPERETVRGLKHRRVQPAWFIKKYLRGHFDLTIVDELHQYKSNSGQGEAMGSIVGASKRVLALTGTLSDGKASSLYHILWRICPAEMKADGLNHRSLSKFVHLYGAMETRGRYSEDNLTSAGGSTSRKLVLNPPKEVPGLSPKLFVNHLADKTVFLELGDLGLPLVELDERPVFVDMEEDHALEYMMFHNNLEQEMKKQYALGNTHAFAKFIPSVVNAANQPHVSQTVELGEDGVYFSAPNSEEQLSAKEAKVLEDIQAELEQKRRCMVYVRYSGKADQDKRLAAILKRHGIRVEVLPATVSPEDRIEWLENAVQRDVEVVVTNPKLVECGLDLMLFPTLLFYQFTDEINTLRQASRRAWRLMQHRLCKVLYYAYNGTYEMVQLKRFLTKRSHSMLLEGRLDKSTVAQFTEQDDKSASTFAIASCLGNVEDLSSKWSALADKDIPSGVVMLAEEQFQEEIGRAMQRLASETRRLAGVFEPVELPQLQENASHSNRQDDIQGNLMDMPLFAAAATYTNEDTPSSAPTENVIPLTVGNWREQMGMVAKAKRVKKMDKVANDQVLLFAL